MKLRTRLNLVMAGLATAFVIALIAVQIRGASAAVREEIVGANRVAAQLLEQLALVHAREGGQEHLRLFLEQLGRVRANEVTLRSPEGVVLYRSPPSPWKMGRAAPTWFARLFRLPAADHTFALPDGASLTVEPQSSRAILDAWDDVTRLLWVAAILLALASALAFWLVGRALAPLSVIAEGLARIGHGDLAHRLPMLSGAEAQSMGKAFNRMAQAVQDNVQAERAARDAQLQLAERREMTQVVEQRIEEERRLIAHELHDEFGQSVTAIRSLALAIAAQPDRSTTADTARLISDEAARLYDAMHGLIPRLTPLSLDTLGLADTLESLVRDWQRRHPSLMLTLRHELPGDLGPSVALTIYRIVQEGLINALRHAQAKRIDIALGVDAQRIVVTVQDDGVGLPLQWSRPGHFGLRGLADRVAHLGGSFEIANREPRGMRLAAEIPLTVLA